MKRVEVGANAPVLQAIRRTKAMEGMVLLLGALGLVGGVILAGGEGGRMTYPVIAGGFAVLLLALILIARHRARLRQQLGNEGMVEYQERFQRRWVRSLAIMPLLMSPMVLNASVHLYSRAVDGTPMPLYAMVGGLVPLGYFAALVIWNSDDKLRELLDDELMRAFRASALLWGFCAAFVGLLLVFGAAILEPALAVALVPGVMMLAVWVAGLRFWHQFRAADRG